VFRGENCWGYIEKIYKIPGKGRSRMPPMISGLAAKGFVICPVDEAEVIATRVGDQVPDENFIAHAGVVQGDLVFNVPCSGGELEILPKADFLRRLSQTPHRTIGLKHQ